MKKDYTFTKKEKATKHNLYRDELERQVEIYLESGGHIQKIESCDEASPKARTMQDAGGLLS